MHLVPGCPAHLVLMFVLFHCLMCYEQINDSLIDVKLSFTRLQPCKFSGPRTFDAEFAGK